MRSERADLLDLILPLLIDDSAAAGVKIFTEWDRDLKDDPVQHWFVQQRLTSQRYPEKAAELIREAPGRYAGVGFGNAVHRCEAPWIDLPQALIYRRDGPIELTATEMRIMECLARRPTAVIAREILSEVISRDHTGAVWTDPKHHVRKLRLKLGDDPHRPFMIVSRRGIGYMLGECLRGRIRLPEK